MVCRHPERATIDAQLLTPGSHVATIAREWGLGRQSLRAHRDKHVSRDAIIRAESALHQLGHSGGGQTPGAPAAELSADQVRASILSRLESSITPLTLLLDACDRWLRDPSDPSRYTVDPRAWEIGVIYMREIQTPQGPRRVTARGTLQDLIKQSGVQITGLTWAKADPRELIVATAGAVRDSLTTIARLLGQLGPDSQVVNVFMLPEWREVEGTLLRVLSRFPEARFALAGELGRLGAGESITGQPVAVRDVAAEVVDG